VNGSDQDYSGRRERQDPGQDAGVGVSSPGPCCDWSSLAGKLRDGLSSGLIRRRTAPSTTGQVDLRVQVTDDTDPPWTGDRRPRKRAVTERPRLSLAGAFPTPSRVCGCRPGPSKCEATSYRGIVTSALGIRMPTSSGVRGRTYRPGHARLGPAKTIPASCTEMRTAVTLARSLPKARPAQCAKASPVVETRSQVPSCA
jgi:hypothetical protein